MNSFELNKILGAILFTGLCILALNIGAGAIFAPEAPKKPGYAIAVKEHGAEEKKPEAEKPIAVLLASASAERGAKDIRVCEACHDFAKGGPNKVGPNLYGIVDRPRASHPGFNYSAAMKAKGGNWTFDELNKFLQNPRGYISGTNMTFAGLPRDTQRADVIAYLRTLSDNPVPLPKAEAPAPAPSQAAAPAPAGAPAQAPGAAPKAPAPPPAAPAAPKPAPAAPAPAAPPAPAPAAPAAPPAPAPAQPPAAGPPAPAAPAPAPRQPAPKPQ